MSDKGKSSKGGHDRSAVTGRYVTPEFAVKHPKTTVHETPSKKK